MTQNPYAQAGPPEMLPDVDEPPRTSVLAILSLIFSLICCIPGLGALAVLLGAGSLIGISKSGGRKSGTGLAIAGIVIGLLVSIGQIAIVIGANSVAGEAGAPASKLLSSIESSQPTKVRSDLAPAASSALTDEQIAQFRSAYQSEWGAYQSTPSGLWQLVMDYIELAQAVETGTAAAQAAYPPPANSMFPWPAEFSGGKTVVFVVVQPPAGGKAAMDVRNIGILKKDNTLIWLIPPSGSAGSPGGPGGTGGSGGAPPPAPSGASGSGGTDGAGGAGGAGGP